MNKGATVRGVRPGARSLRISAIVNQVNDMPKLQLDTVSIADRLRPVLLRVGRELRRGGPRGRRLARAGVAARRDQVRARNRRRRARCRGARLGAGDVEPRRPARARRPRRAHAERDDRRRVGLTLTDEGQRVLRRVRSRRTAWLVSPARQADAGRARRGRSRRRAALAAAARGRSGREAHVREPALPELPSLLRRPGRLADRLVDAADRTRLVRPPAHPRPVRRRGHGASRSSCPSCSSGSSPA